MAYDFRRAEFVCFYLLSFLEICLAILRDLDPRMNEPDEYVEDEHDSRYEETYGVWFVERNE